MLRRLVIANFAIIEKLELEFSGGLTAFTGETGAGKSILIEALGFLLGERGSTDWLRSGAAKLEVAGEFDENGRTFRIRRELDANGRSRAFLDDKPVKLDELAALGERLADFHGQHEHQSLLKPALQLELLDEFGSLSEPRRRVRAAFARWGELRSEVEGLKISDEERLRRVDLYGFQLREIAAVEPRAGEDAELEAELPRLKNAGKLLALAQTAYGELYENEGSAEESLRRAEAALEAMSHLDPGAGSALTALARAREASAEAAALLARYRGDSGEESDSAARLDELIGRQDSIARLKRKYGATIEEIFAFRDRIKAELESLENHEARALEAEKLLDGAEGALRERCEELHKARRKAAQTLSSRAAAELKDLALAEAKLSISVELEEGAYSANGSDRVEFLIATNPGEPLKALRAIASGGELARVMLALKTVLAREDKVGLMVFDEVDTGVGGPVGRFVGEKLARIGRTRQVFCVTHLAQVACFADAHFEVLKSTARGRASASVSRLEDGRRVEAVARMLGGRKASAAGLRHAQELMEDCAARPARQVSA